MNSKPTILIVEDDELSLKFFKLYLSKMFDLILVRSVEEFYNIIKSEIKFDVILMDISLRDEKDGLQLTRELREMQQYKDCPIIALTANVFKKDELAAYEAGVSKFLRKPIENEKLLSEIYAALNRTNEQKSD